MAPGGDSSGSQAYMVYSTLNSGTKGPGSPSYGYMEGTSMATPHVSGLVALMASVDPALVQEEAESILKLTARPFPASSGSSKCDSTTCGAGLADATAAIKFMQARPVNDRCAAAVPLTCGSLVTGSTQYATALSADAPCGSTSATSVDVWYSLALSATTAVHLSTCQNDTTFNTQLAVYSGACSKLSCIAGQDDSPSCGTQTVLSVSLPAGTNLIRVSGKGTDRGAFSLAVTCDGAALPPTGSPSPLPSPGTVPDPSPVRQLPSPQPSPDGALPDPGVSSPICQATPATCNSVVSGTTATVRAAFFWPDRPHRPGWPRFPGMPFVPGQPLMPYPPTTPGQPYPPTMPSQPGQPGQGCQGVSLDTPATWYSLALSASSTVMVRSSQGTAAGMEIAAFSGDCSNPTCLASTGAAQQGTQWQQLYIQAQGQVWLAVFGPQGSAASYQLQISCS
eukprot:GGOE01009954.1.p1 GENE.GGOE01009954.1~~GGOE01009954.1.p1  ORF type:complete len:451 (+),score=101.27 GGOE01009954.1:1153-2505(+)